jgi:pimeloyl-ACP methyl ester carboxylesterase
MSDGMVTVAPGLRLYYRWAGTRRDNPIIVPLGTWWGRQLDRLAANHAVLLYDPRGRGRSNPRPEAGGGMDDDIEDLEQLRQQLHIGSISLIGWSYLGAVVALYTSRYLPNVDRLVQVGPMVPRPDPYWPQFIADYTARAQSAADATGAKSVWTPVIRPQLADPTMAEAILSSLDLTSANEDPARINAWAAKMMASRGAWDFREQAARISVPVLTIHGRRDNIPVAASREWSSSFKNGRLLLIDGAGHYPHFEQPAVFGEALQTFFAGSWPPGAASA